MSGKKFVKLKENIVLAGFSSHTIYFVLFYNYVNDFSVESR